MNNYEKTCVNAPEILKGKGYCDKSDLLNIGVIIYALYFNDYPFKGTNTSKILKQINLVDDILRKSENSALDDLIRKLLIEDPEQRLSWDEYFHHPFFSTENEDKEILEKNMKYKIKLENQDLLQFIWRILKEHMN